MLPSEEEKTDRLTALGQKKMIRASVLEGYTLYSVKIGIWQPSTMKKEKDVRQTTSGSGLPPQPTGETRWD